MPKIVRIKGGWKLSKALYAQTIILHDVWNELNMRNWVYSHTFKLTHPSTKFSGSENGHIREKSGLPHPLDE